MGRAKTRLSPTAPGKKRRRAPGCAEDRHGTVLVVDDEANHRLLCRMVLEDDGHVVLEAGSGAEALRMLENVRPHAVLLDLRLPDLHGLHLLDVIASAYPGISVIVYSGSEDCRPSDPRAVWLKKSSDVERLGHVVRRVLSSAPRRSRKLLRDGGRSEASERVRAANPVARPG